MRDDTMNGSCEGYTPEWSKAGANDWHSVPTHPSANGVPAPRNRGLLLPFVGLFGYEQAMALAWQYAAMLASQDGTHADARAVKHTVTYHIKITTGEPNGE